MEEFKIENNTNNNDLNVHNTEQNDNYLLMTIDDSCNLL